MHIHCIDCDKKEVRLTLSDVEINTLCNMLNAELKNKIWNKGTHNLHLQMYTAMSLVKHQLLDSVSVKYLQILQDRVTAEENDKN